MTALWWLIVTLPLLKGYKQKNYVETKAVTVGQTFGKIFGTLKKMAVSDRKVFFFLIGFFLYIERRRNPSSTTASTSEPTST